MTGKNYKKIEVETKIDHFALKTKLHIFPK